MDILLNLLLLGCREDQWKKITDAFDPSSASTAAPAFLAIAAGVAGLALC